ncbi:MAG: hypothetical protein QME16_00220 [Planctomycetota bacterium]|nr:hypothetical protein [Planctomycetota bacterium]
MVKNITILIFFFFASPAFAEPLWHNYSDSQIVEAIGKAENSRKFPYGIKSINTHSNIAYARKICLQSVKNGRKRWEKAGRPVDLIEYISRRYCPVNAPDDNGTNRFWSRNVKNFLRKGVKK